MSAKRFSSIEGAAPSPRWVAIALWFTLLVGSFPAAELEPAMIAMAAASADVPTGEPVRLAPASPLSLSECVRLALEHNPNLRAARKEQSIQALEKPRAFASFLPTLDAEGTYTRFKERQRVVPAHRNNEPGVFDEDFLEGGLVLRLPIFQGGRRVAAYRIAELAGRLASEQLTASRQDLVLNVASTFYKTLQLDRVIRATEASREALQSQTATTRLRVEVGRSAPVDSMKIEVRLASIEQSLSRLEADRRLLLVQLGRLIGMSDQSHPAFQIAGRLTAAPQPLPDFENARKLAREQRPELKAAQARLEQAERGLDLARADYWPRVDGFARYGSRSGLPYDQKGDSNALDHETSWMTGVQVDLPLFRGGAVRTQVAQARLRIDQAREILRGVELLIGEDLDRAFTVLSDSRNRMAVTGKNVETAEETFRIEQVTYREGRNTINDVLDAQAARLTADVEHSQAVVDYVLARLEWERAVGNDMPLFAFGDSTTHE